MKQPIDIIKEILIKGIIEGNGDLPIPLPTLAKLILDAQETLYVSFDKRTGDNPVSMYAPILSFTHQYPDFIEHFPGIVSNYFAWVLYEPYSDIKDLDSYDHEDLIFSPDSKESKMVIDIMKAYHL